MKNNYYRKLNIPVSPLIDDIDVFYKKAKKIVNANVIPAVDRDNQFVCTKVKKMFEPDFGYIEALPDNIIKPEVLELFTERGLTPLYITILVYDSNAVTNLGGFYKELWNAPAIHTDLYFNSETMAWERTVFAANWDLLSPGRFEWWDIPLSDERVKELGIPLISENIVPSVVIKHNIIKYNEDTQLPGPEPSTARIITSTLLDKPALVRADVPHCVRFTSPDQERLSLSIRLKNTDLSPEEVLALFDDLALLNS